MFENNYLNIILVARHISHIVNVSENKCADIWHHQLF